MALKDAMQRAGFTTNTTANDGTALEPKGTYDGTAYYHDPARDVVAIRARARAT